MKKKDRTRSRKERGEKREISKWESNIAGKRGGEKERVETGHGAFTKREWETKRRREKRERCEKESKGVLHGGNCG